MELAKKQQAELDGAPVAILSMNPIEIDDPNILNFTPGASKGMEFDGVVVVEPAEILQAHHGLGLLYVAVTRTTNQLAIVHEQPLPNVLDSRPCEIADDESNSS